MELKKYKLEECCLHITDGEHGSVNDDLQGDYYLLSNKNIINGNIVISKDDRKINKATFDKINKRILLEEKDVIISTVGTLGKTAIIEGNINYTFQRSVGIIKPNPQIIDSHYLKYLLDTDYYQQLLIGLSVGAVQKCIFIGTLKSLPISIPSLPTQKKIANILQTLDQKIALNRQINDNLEAMAKQLYDYWFVQFDFPNEEGKPYKSSGGKMVYNPKLKREIPEGWEVKSIFDELSVQYGFPFSTELFTNEPTEIPVVRIRDILDNSISAYSHEVADEKYRLNEADLLIGMDGNFHMNYWIDNISYLNQRSVCLRGKTQSTVSILQARFDIAPYIKAKEQRVKGSTVGHLSDKDLKELHVLVCPNNKFKKVLDSLLKRIIANRKENINLTKQRDELLPLLMNGQVSVD